jgi:hypothetical protein
MRRTIVALMAAAGLVLAMTAPVAAKGKPQKPTDPPELVEVTMTGDLATTCGPMVMERSGTELFGVGPTLLDLAITGVDSSRYGAYDDPDWSYTYPTKAPSTGFSGCHGEQLDGTESPYGGLGITVDETGAVTDLLWHFDYYLAFSDGKRPRLEVMEHFTLSGHDLSWDAATSTVSGSFDVLYHLEDRPNRVSIGYVSRGSVDLSFTFTMTPHA